MCGTEAVALCLLLLAWEIFGHCYHSHLLFFFQQEWFRIYLLCLFESGVWWLSVAKYDWLGEMPASPPCMGMRGSNVNQVLTQSEKLMNKPCRITQDRIFFVYYVVSVTTCHSVYTLCICGIHECTLNCIHYLPLLMILKGRNLWDTLAHACVGWRCTAA